MDGLLSNDEAFKKVVEVAMAPLEPFMQVTHSSTLLALLNLPPVELSLSINLAQMSCMVLKQFTLFLQGQICAALNVGVLLTEEAKIRQRSDNNKEGAQLQPQLLER